VWGVFTVDGWGEQLKKHDVGTLSHFWLVYLK
jgi:hypothetical protein